MNGTSGGPTSQISSPAMDRLLDDDADGANERWSDRFSFVAKDSYGNLRYVSFLPCPVGTRVVDAGLQFYRGSLLDDVCGGIEFVKRFPYH
jgi:hypothetical protein